jgi:hypothetical protein
VQACFVASEVTGISSTNLIQSGFSVSNHNSKNIFGNIVSQFQEQIWYDKMKESCWYRLRNKRQRRSMHQMAGLTWFENHACIVNSKISGRSHSIFHFWWRMCIKWQMYTCVNRVLTGFCINITHFFISMHKMGNIYLCS